MESNQTRDRREYPRVEVMFPVELLGSDGRIVQGMGLNVSRVGLQLGCDSKTAEELLPKEADGRPTAPNRLHVRFTLKASDSAFYPVEAHCNVVYVKQMPDGDYRMGLYLKYGDFVGEGRENLEAFIIESLRYT